MEGTNKKSGIKEEAFNFLTPLISNCVYGDCLVDFKVGYEWIKRKKYIYIKESEVFKAFKKKKR